VLNAEKQFLELGAPAAIAEAAGFYLAKSRETQKSLGPRVSPPDPVKPVIPDETPSTKQSVDALKNTLHEQVRHAANRSFAFVEFRTNNERERLRSEAFKRVNAAVNDAFGIAKGQRDRLTAGELQDAIARCKQKEFDLPLGWERTRG